MNARDWFSTQSFNSNSPRVETPVAAKARVMFFDRWDAERGCWRHYRQDADGVTETDEVGLPL